MICPVCQGARRFPPCPECGGCGFAHCCEGDVACGWLPPKPLPLDLPDTLIVIEPDGSTRTVTVWNPP